MYSEGLCHHPAAAQSAGIEFPTLRRPKDLMLSTHSADRFGCAKNGCRSNSALKQTLLSAQKPVRFIQK